MTVATLRIRGLLGVVTIALAGCTAVNQTTRPAELVGTVSLPDGADLHQKTVVVISLVDLDRMDVVNQVVEETPVQHPIRSRSSTTGTRSSRRISTGSKRSSSSAADRATRTSRWIASSCRAIPTRSTSSSNR